MVEDRRTFEPTESIEEAERLFIEDFDTWDMTGYYLYSKLLRSGVSAHIGTWGTGKNWSSLAAGSCSSLDCFPDLIFIFVYQQTLSKHLPLQSGSSTY